MILRKIITMIIMAGISVSSIFAGSLSGRVNFQGNAPKKKTLKMDADPVCGSAHETPPYRQSFIMNDEGYIKNVMLYLQDVKYDGETPETQAVLDQKGCMYLPHVQGMMAGQELLIKNSDATLHNIHGLPTINSQFNFAMPKVVKEKAIKISMAESSFKIKCDVHPWMKAYLSVFNHPYFAVTDTNGKFEITGIPAGDYEVVFWHEKAKGMGGVGEYKVRIGKDGETVAVFTQDHIFVRPKKKK